MKISLRKLTNSTHELTVTRDDGSIDSVVCETRSSLVHDFTHLAVESEAGLKTGFWGLLAAGKTFEDLNDRTGESIADMSDDILVIEAVVGCVQGIRKGLSGDVILANLRMQGQGLGWTIPPWLTEDMLQGVQERLRRLVGHWKATRFGESMEVEWSA